MLIYQLFLLLIVSLFPECISQGCDCPRTPRNGFTSGCVRSGLSVSYHCDPGYSLEGNSTRTCMSNGSWTGIAPMCQENLCPCPQFPANGYTRGCAEEGPTVSYHCYTGYSLVGTSTRTCNNSGMWSGSAPVCRKERG
jgi:CUB/sushi domain-containing protein